MPHGIEIDPARRERFREGARILGLDEKTIARQARLSPRVVREVLSGQRTRVSAKTGARLERVLLGTGARPLPALGRPLRRARAIPLLVSFVLVAAGLFAWRLASTPPDAALAFQCGERRVAIRDARAGRMLWDSTLTTRVAIGFIAPWEEASMVIYGTRTEGRDGGKLFARDLLSGELLWWLRIPDADAARHFPEGVAATGRFMPSRTGGPDDCARVCTGDIDGDGVADIVVRWIFEPWYPACATWYSLDPEHPRHLIEKGRYFTCGAVGSVAMHDIDGDGRPGVVIAGTNNASGYQGAMVTFLDAGHWSGGSVDSVAAATHWRSPPQLEDGSLARIVFPQFDAEFMTALGYQRLDVSHVSISGDTIEVGIGHSNSPCVVIRLDPCLDLIDVRAAPIAATALAAAPEALQRRFADGYLQEWIGRRVRFGACLR